MRSFDLEKCLLRRKSRSKDRSLRQRLQGIFEMSMEAPSWLSR
jgi:hypothetical protein